MNPVKEPVLAELLLWVFEKKLGEPPPPLVRSPSSSKALMCCILIGDMPPLLWWCCCVPLCPAPPVSMSTKHRMLERERSRVLLDPSSTSSNTFNAAPRMGVAERGEDEIPKTVD